MIISIPIDTTLKSSNVDDKTPHYRQDNRRWFRKGLRLQSGSEIYEWHSDNLYPPNYLLANSSQYKIGDILWCKNPTDDGSGSGDKVQGIVQVSARKDNPVPKQPDLYPNVDTNLEGYTSWQERYVYVDTITGDFNGFTKSVGRYTHKLFRSSNSHTGWYYKIWYAKKGVPYWRSEEFSRPTASEPNNVKTFIRIKYKHGDSGEYSVAAFYDGVQVIETSSSTSPLEPGKTIFSGNTQGNLYTGKPFLLGAIRTQHVNTAGQTVIYYALQRQGYKTVRVETKQPAEVLEFIAPGTVEREAQYVGVGPGDPDYPNDKDVAYILKTFILRNGKLYARTHINSAQQTTMSTTAVIEEVHYLRDFLKGWTYVSPVNKLKPFDGKTYTKVTGSGPMQFVVQGVGRFDTVALTGVIANRVEITGAGFNITHYRPNGKRDVDGRLPDIGTTVILYAQNDSNSGAITITLHGTRIELGGIHLGLSVNAGFTNLSFTNQFKDFSPFEQDQWGNITYKEGAKVNTHSGTVDVPIRQYDMMNRLMTSLGKGMVMLNGSDTRHNSPIDSSSSIFASTMVVGRITNFELRTKLDNKRLGEMATYSFKIEEAV